MNININDEIKKYFIPSFYHWNFHEYILFKEVPTLPFSRFIVIDNTVILKLMYHCPNRWSFVRVDKHFKADSSEKLTFITNTDFIALLMCIKSIHQVIELYKIDEYSFILEQ